MTARRIRGAWWVDFRYERERYRRKSTVDNKRGAVEYERQLRERLLQGRPLDPREDGKEVPTFAAWFKGRFWEEWVVARDNKQSERESKECIFDNHLEPFFGAMRLDDIDSGSIARFKASLLAPEESGRVRSKKRINNILSVLSTPMKYAAEEHVIARAPKVGIFKIERPEVECYDFEQYGRILDAARVEGPVWLVAALFAGDAGLRKGEIMALRYREDLDLVGAMITVNRGLRHGHFDTPKGGRRRFVPVTDRLLAAIKSLSQVRTGLVVRDDAGAPLSDRVMTCGIYRICRRAGLPERAWHVIRHTYGTHGALFGVNPWKLQAWMGHRRIEETMRYVHIAEDHHREIPAAVLDAGDQERDPDRRVLRMLGARGGTNVGTSWAPARPLDHTSEGTTRG